MYEKVDPMEVINYFARDKKAELLAQIEACDWGAARFLGKLLREGTFLDMLGGWGALYLLMDGESLVSFATLTGQDCIRDESLCPWVGFVYTRPEYRGRRYSAKLLTHCEAEAAALGYGKLYIATDHMGLYEKFGYLYLENRRDYRGEDTRILYKALEKDTACNSLEAEKP